MHFIKYRDYNINLDFVKYFKMETGNENYICFALNDGDRISWYFETKAGTEKVYEFLTKNFVDIENNKEYDFDESY